MNRWYVATTQHRAEFIALENLMNQEFGAFLPTANKRVKQRRKLIEKTVPLYPNYLFINFDAQIHMWRAINGTRGIRQLMTDGFDRPRPIPVGLIEQLILRSRNGGFGESRDGVRYSFRPGSRVTITEGPFSGFEGICIEALVTEIKIMLDVFGRKTETRIPVEAVECVA